MHLITDETSVNYTTTAKPQQQISLSTSRVAFLWHKGVTIQKVGINLECHVEKFNNYV